jgi:CBS domain-containing protein
MTIHVEDQRVVENAGQRGATVADVMSSRVVTVPLDATLEAVWQRMWAAQCEHVVVVTPAGKIAGVVDERSIAVEWSMGVLEPHRREIREIGDVLSAVPFCVTPETPLAAAAHLMAARRLDAVAVVAPDGTPVGIVTSTNIVSFVASDVPVSAVTIYVED